MKPIRLLIIAGSARNGAYSRALARVAAAVGAGALAAGDDQQSDGFHEELRAATAGCGKDILSSIP